MSFVDGGGGCRQNLDLWNMSVLAMGLVYFYEFSYRPGVRKLIIRMGLGVNGFGVSVQDFFCFFEHRKKP